MIPRLPVRFYLFTLLSLTAALATLSQPSATDWPRWRGARFDGTAITANRAFDRPFALKVRWKTAIGSGYSGVVIAEGHAVTMTSDGKSDYLISLNSSTGKINWRVPVGAAFPSRDGSTGGPVSTPAIDSGVAYGLGPYGEFVAVSLATGKTVWKRDLVKELNAVTPHWGFTTSPLVMGDAVLVMIGGSGQALVALNKRTGATIWRTGTDEVNYGSPMVARLDGRDVVLWGGDKYLAAVDPADGRELWSYEHGGTGFFMRIINPVVVNPGELMLTYRGDEAVLLRTSSASTGKPSPVWTSRELRGNYATPVVQGSHVYGYAGAFLTCVDARTGTLAWRSRPPGDGWPILVDGHLVVATKQGRIAIAEANPRGYNEKAGMEVFDRLVWTPPAFAEGRIYARDSYTYIAAVDIEPVTRAAAPAPAPAKPAPGFVPGTQFARWVAETEGQPDAAERVKQFLAQQKTFPIIEGDRYAHILYDGPEADVALRADTLEFVRAVPMRRVAGTNLRYMSFQLAPDARILYQFERNLTERIPDPRNPLQIASLFFPERSALLLMPRASRELPSPPAAGLRGKVVEHEIESPQERAETLTWGGKRKIWVYLPPGYDTDTQKRYPTVYVLNGQDMRNDGLLDAVVDREIGATLPPMILVFVQRNNGYEHARTFRAVHRRMLVEQLVPWIDGQYRTRPGAAQRALTGSNEGGFGVIETGIHHPEVFGKILAQSGYKVGTHDSELFDLIGRSSHKTQQFYLDWGVYDGERENDEVNIPGFMRTASERLRARGYRVTTRELNEGGASPFWVQRLLPALRAFFPR